MSGYRVFVAAFIIYLVSLVVVIVSYCSGIIKLLQAGNFGQEATAEILAVLLSPVFLVSLVLLIVSSLTFRVLGIVFVARNQVISGGEKAMWVIGFLVMGFVTAIVFMVMGRSRHMLGAAAAYPGQEGKPVF